MNENEKFANILKVVRTRWNPKLTIRELSALSGISHPYVSQLENNKRDSLPKPEILFKLATGFGKSNNKLVNHIYNLFMASCNYISLDMDSALSVSKRLIFPQILIEKLKILFNEKNNTNLLEFRYILFILGFENAGEPTDQQLLDKTYQLKILKEIEKDNIRNAQLNTGIFYEKINKNIELSKIADNSYSFYLDDKLLSETEKTMILGTLKAIRQLREDLKK